MYNLPEMRQANSTFWSALRDLLTAEGVHGLPEVLDFNRAAVPSEIGSEVLFTQACGYPLQTRYAGQYRLLATPNYDCPGCFGPNHSAFIVTSLSEEVRTLGDLRGAIFAFNSIHSNSGMNLPRLSFAKVVGKPLFSKVVETGSHAASLEMVARKEADATSVDCVTFAFYKTYRPSAVRGLRVLAETVRSPSLPFVTSRRTDARTTEALRRSLLKLGAAPEFESIRRNLMIVGMTVLDATDYERVLSYEGAAVELGYPVIR